MVNRENWKAVKAYLKYRADVDMLSQQSIRLEESWLRHLLEWAQEDPFTHAPTFRPTFPVYIQTSRLDGSDKPFSSEYNRKIVSTARRFLRWLSKHKRGYKEITPAWLDTIKPRQAFQGIQEHEAVTFEEILNIAFAPVVETWEKRIQATAVFLFLSGMRVGAFVTLPLEAVNLETRTIYQWPSLGVKTKKGKHSTTYLLNIPELLDVALRWDKEVRADLPSDCCWFALLSPETGKVCQGVRTVGKHRHARVRKDLRRWLDRVDLPYHSPHKFRHGHAVYALKMAKNVADLKAVSQNLMHANLSITDGVYGVLSSQDVGERISMLGVNNSSSSATNNKDLIASLESLLNQIKEEQLLLNQIS
jgi:integrase